MKQKIVIEVCMNDDKYRKKALKIAVGRRGIISAALQGQDKIEVIGEGVDPAELTTTLRKKVGFAQLLSVSAEDDKKDDKKDDKPPAWPYYDIGVPFYPQIYEVREPSSVDPCCTIM